MYPRRNRALLYLFTLLSGSPLLAQSAWTKAPALPKACYRTQDTFDADVAKARSELEGAIERQKEINSSLFGQLLNMDPATLQQRLMAAIQKDPQKAPEIIQYMQNLGTAENQGANREMVNAPDGFKEKQTKAQADYKADWNATLGPIAARANTEDGAVLRAARAEYNRTYQTAFCPRWFGRDFPALSSQYREHLVNQVIPQQVEHEAFVLRQLELFGVPSQGFKPVAEMNAVVAYLRLVAELYVQREIQPHP